MITIQQPSYNLLLSHNPCDVFYHYNVPEMHGLSLEECKTHTNTHDSAYIAGWTNYEPHDDTKRFVYINLSRCNNAVRTTALIMHELMHQSLWLHNYDLTKEEEIITWAEEETYNVIKIINRY